MQQWAVLRFVTTFGNSKGLKGVGGLLMRDATPPYTDYYFFVWRKGRNGSHIHLSHHPTPSPLPPPPVWLHPSAQMIRQQNWWFLPIFMIWNDLWKEFWPSLKTINVNVVNVVLRVTLFLFGVRNVPHLLHSDLQSSSFFRNAITPSPTPLSSHPLSFIYFLTQRIGTVGEDRKKQNFGCFWKSSRR